MSSSDERNNNLVNNATTSLAHTDQFTTMAVAGVALAGAAFYYYNQSLKYAGSRPKSHLIDRNYFENQTREVKNNGGRINSICKKDECLDYLLDNVKTMYDTVRRAEKISNNGNYLGWKPSANEPFKWLKYSEANEISRKIGSAFLKFGLEPSKEAMVGIFAKNRPEWVLTEHACNAYSLVSVPLYDTLGAEAISFILMQTELKVVICDDSQKALQLMNQTKTNLEYIIIIEKISDEALKKAQELNIKIMSFENLKQTGAENLREPIPPKTDDLATICYTSGTTGTPKGAMITHKNMVSVASSMLVYFRYSGIIKDGQEKYLSYLPLAHMFERVVQLIVASIGGQIGFYQGDIKKLIDDVQELKPTVFCTVPRVLNRLYAKIQDNLEKAPAYKKALFKWAFSQKEKEVLAGIVRNNSIYDIIFKPIRKILGGSVKFIITGSAPISPEILHFLRVVSGCHVLEGYGATETGGATCVQLPFENTVGNVGPPFMCSKFKLVDVPEMGLEVSKDKRGEVLIAGNNIFKGYYKDEEKTKAALDADGWYHTGDIGVFEANGTLKLVDRVKNIFKLQQGEYIVPEKIENIYVRSKFVAQIFIYGNSYKSSLVAIVVPEELVLFEWAKNNNLELNMSTLCKNDEVKKMILKDIVALGKAGGLKGFEQVRDIHLHPELFTVESGFLTPTMKSKRTELQKHFQTVIDDMYKNAD